VKEGGRVPRKRVCRILTLFLQSLRQRLSLPFLRSSMQRLSRGLYPAISLTTSRTNLVCLPSFCATRQTAQSVSVQPSSSAFHNPESTPWWQRQNNLCVFTRTNIRPPRNAPGHHSCSSCACPPRNNPRQPSSLQSLVHRRQKAQLPPPAHAPAPLLVMQRSVSRAPPSARPSRCPHDSPGVPLPFPSKPLDHQSKQPACASARVTHPLPRGRASSELPLLDHEPLLETHREAGAVNLGKACHVVFSCERRVCKRTFFYHVSFKDWQF
jgi:hypothetical protein